MTTQGNGQRVPYNVHMSAQNAAELKQQHLDAAQQGWGQQFVSTVRQIVERLRNDPLEFGEPLYRLPSLKLQVRQAVMARLVVTYAIHEERPLVFIRGFKVLS
jgi:hypothetical protein